MSQNETDFYKRVTSFVGGVPKEEVEEALRDAKRYHDLQKRLLEPEFSPEFIRWGIARIKALSKLREPNYEQPADSFIENAVREIALSAIREVSINLPKP